LEEARWEFACEGEVESELRGAGGGSHSLYLPLLLTLFSQTPTERAPTLPSDSNSSLFLNSHSLFAAPFTFVF
jgi:hypothetical protein